MVLVFFVPASSYVINNVSDVLKLSCVALSVIIRSRVLYLFQHFNKLSIWWLSFEEISWFFADTPFSMINWHNLLKLGVSQSLSVVLAQFLDIG